MGKKRGVDTSKAEAPCSARSPLRKLKAEADNIAARLKAPTHLDGSPVDKDEAAKVHAGLVSGEMKIELAPGVAEELAAAGLTVEDMRKMLIASSKKTMS